jgi:hypothetical protein
VHARNAECAHQLLNAAIDILETTFSNKREHEAVFHRPHAYFVPDDTLETIFFLLYEASTNARALREATAQ